jgi:hypothetical protein
MDLLALRLQALLITLNYVIDILHAFSSPLHTHQDSPSPSKRNYHFESIKSSCHFFNDLGMPTQFSDSNFPVSVLHGTNLYSLISSIYFHWSSLSVSCQRIYNTLDNSSSNLRQLSSPIQPPVWSGLSYRLSLYRHGTDNAENIALLLRHAYVGVTCDHYLGSPLARWLLPSKEL